ncbi:MAG: TetR/AcrR family transcriptional regulator [Sulfurospirillaceae bacterium]|jgi:AcrR family transcriptional regulator|nr:TetR/AcrR family transcriptional regulator [Sulfurospirillaceae bacterium]MDD2826753.1 TetR/AcrR family transcriptional regulator [Sulfurospirillaceae bacterium]
MACCVSKTQKRTDIALACKELFVKHHHSDITMSQIALTAGIGKGTIYEYFANKEDIVFELVAILMAESNVRKQEKLKRATSTKEKIKVFFEFFYDEESSDLRSIYKEFMSISLLNPNQKIMDFQTNCHHNYKQWVMQIMQEGVDKGEVIPQSLHLIQGMFTFGTGIFITHAITTTVIDIEQEVNNFIDAIFALLTKQN